MWRKLLLHWVSHTPVSWFLCSCFFSILAPFLSLLKSSQGLIFPYSTAMSSTKLSSVREQHLGSFPLVTTAAILAHCMTLAAAYLFCNIALDSNAGFAFLTGGFQLLGLPSLTVSVPSQVEVRREASRFLRGHEFLQASALCFGTALKMHCSHKWAHWDCLDCWLVSPKVQLCFLDCTIVMFAVSSLPGF